MPARQRLLLLNTKDDPPQLLANLLDISSELGLTLDICPWDETNDAAGTENPLSDNLIAVLVSNCVPKPLTTARRWQHCHPDVEFIFLAQADRMDALTTELASSPIVGSRWQIIRGEPTTLNDHLMDPLRDAKQRRRLRETLNRINNQLATPGQPDFPGLSISDRYLASILNSAQDAIVAIEDRERIRTWNKAAERLFGYQETEVVGQPVPILLEDSHKAEFIERLNDSRLTADSSPREFCFKHKDGSIVDVEVTLARVTDESDEELAVSAIVRDIRSRKQAEKALFEESERFRVTLTSIGDAVIATDSQGKITFMNACAQKLTEWTLSEAAGQHITNVFHIINEYSREVVDSPTEMVLRFGEVVGLANHTLLISKNGKEIPIDDSGAPIRNSQGEMIGTVLVFHDISERRAAEEKLKRSEELHRLLVNDIRDYAIFMISPEGHIVSWNRGAERTTGFVEDDVINKPFDLLFTQEDRDAGMPAKELEKAKLEGRASDERWHVQKSGVRFWATGVTTAIKNDDGTLWGYSKVMRDVTEQKLAQIEREQLLAQEQASRTQLERLYRTSQELNRTKDEFLAALSHELRTPLNVILGFSQLLKVEQPGTLDFDQAIDAVHRNAMTQSALINDLLDVSKIITGKLELEVKTTDLESIIKNSIQSVRFSAEAKNIQLTENILCEACLIKGDPLRLQQVVWNLLANAIKFTPKGGRVDVRLERSGSSFVISVKDTGAGITPDFLPYVFERFRQEDGSTTRRFGGLGLGLAIVRHIVDSHGGNIEATSPGKDKGATFRVELPVVAIATEPVQNNPAEATEEPANPGTKHPQTEGVLARIEVLVIDDERDARALVRKVLSGNGAAVKEASSAQDAFEVLKSFKPAVIVCDIGMPEQDGYEFIKTLRSLSESEGAAIPAIALTAYARDIDREKTLAAGYQRHLAKPASPAELVKAVAILHGRPLPS